MSTYTKTSNPKGRTIGTCQYCKRQVFELNDVGFIWPERLCYPCFAAGVDMRLLSRIKINPKTGDND